jgi:hypothetical protein
VRWWMDGSIACSIQQWSFVSYPTVIRHAYVPGLQCAHRRSTDDEMVELVDLPPSTRAKWRVWNLLSVHRLDWTLRTATVSQSRPASPSPLHAPIPRLHPPHSTYHHTD